ncbi:MAG: hypothetical protein Q7R30_20180 [Acidobacteriota bacterium]|nr:hypothetical protein [Acidobacteriota bacterium]
MSTRAAILSYTALSIVLTWPLALGIAGDVPGDLGDSLLNMWILGWGAEHVPRLLTGAMSWQAFWNANIFHPEPLALTFSEHLFGQTLQILPVYWLTGNVILCYNLLFISTFALSAFGTYLLVRDLTGNRMAAFVAGLVYGFLPYRIASVPHLQVMSSQWMPFALYGLNRFVTSPPTRPEAATARPRRSSLVWARAKAGGYPALAGGTAALVMQNWSCGYYLLYFAPFAPLFVMHRMWALGKLKDLRIWISLAIAAAVTLLLTLPFLFPYSQAQQLFGFERPFGEVVLFSANLWSYVTASENLSFWGKTLRYYPHGEGETFLGFVPWLLAIVALVAAVWRGLPALSERRDAASSRGAARVEGTPTRRAVIVLLAIAVVTQFFALMSVVTFGGFDLNVLGLTISARTPQRLLMQFVVAAGLLLVVSPTARGAASRLVRTPLIFFAVATVLAMWLSLGPVPNAGDARGSGFGLYGVLYNYVPGFNGVRVPARYAMIAGLFLAVLAGYGADELFRIGKVRWAGTSVPAVLTVVLAVLILIEGAAIPMEMNRTWAQNEAVPPARVYPASSLARRSLVRLRAKRYGETSTKLEERSRGGGAPPVYARVASLPAGSAITEFPFGDAAWEIRYVYYAHTHWKPITNGYSGAFPPAYKARVARLSKVSANPEAAWRALVDSGSSHAIVHPKAFANAADAAAVESWLRAHNAQELERFPDGDILFKLKTEL